MNALDAMTYEERFHVAFLAILALEAELQRARESLVRERNRNEERDERCAARRVIGVERMRIRESHHK